MFMVCFKVPSISLGESPEVLIGRRVLPCSLQPSPQIVSVRLPRVFHRWYQLSAVLRHWLPEMPCPRYNQRSPLEYTFFRPFPRLVFGCINADFCVQGRIFQRFSSSTFFPLHHSRFLWFFRTFAPFFTEFDAIFAEFQERQQILQIFVKISPNFFRISQNFNDFDRSDVKMTIFYKNLRKIAEIIRNFLAKIVKICPKKCILVL